MGKDFGEEIKVKGQELVKKVKELIHEGNIRRIIIKNNEDKILLEIPLTVGLVGAFFAPILAAVGALATFALDYKLQIIKREDEEKDQDTKQAGTE